MDCSKMTFWGRVDPSATRICGDSKAVVMVHVGIKGSSISNDISTEVEFFFNGLDDLQTFGDNIISMVLRERCKWWKVE